MSEFSDVEGLITLHGVLCAFLLSVSLGVEISTGAEPMAKADFYGLIAKEQDFRLYVVSLLNETYGSEGPPFGARPGWNVTVASGVTVDVLYELEVGIHSRWPGGDNTLISKSAQYLPRHKTRSRVHGRYLDKSCLIRRRFDH